MLIFSVTLCVACRSSFDMSVVCMSDNSDFREKHFKISHMQSLLFNWFLKFCQCLFLYIQCDKFTKLVAYLGCCGHRRGAPCCKKQNKNKKQKQNKTCFFYTVCMFVFTYSFCFTNTNVYSNKNQSWVPLSQFPILKIHPDMIMRLKDALARCCLHSLRSTQSEV